MSKLNVDNIENRLGTGGPQLPGATFTDNIVGTAASFTGIVTATSLSVTDITATGNVSIAGTLTYEDVTNVDSVGIITARSDIIVGGGLTVTGISTFNDTVEVPSDSKKILLGAEKEMQVFHDGTDSLIKDTRNSGSVKIQADSFSVIDKDASETMLSATADGNVELKYDGSTKIQTTNTGAVVTGILTATSFSGDGSNVTNVNATTLDTIDSTQFLRSDAADTKTSGDLNFDDNIKANFGTGSDLEIYHDGSNSYIVDSGTGNLIMKSAGSFLLQGADNNENIIVGNQDGSVELWYDNSKKIETTTSGVTVTGTVSDSIGPLRRLGINSQSGAYTLVAGDAGKAVTQSTNSAGVTVPNSVFSAGDMVTIINNTGTNINIIQGSGLTMYNTADAATGTRTLAQRGAATLLFTSASVAYISGSDLS